MTFLANWKRLGVTAVVAMGLGLATSAGATPTAGGDVEGMLKAAGEAMAQSDYPVALRQFAMAAESGSARGQAGLAILFAAGHGVDRNPLQAYKWILVAETTAKTQRPGMVEKIASFKKDIGAQLDDVQRVRGEELAKEYLTEKGWK
ncbi:sel1 repeat family protein [Magnetofaba australis]|uniref:Sel1 repeat family protein n=1 Tax=Magnetofaba australis IT-1 TaxID=1434232 RepID=A0A1Y2K0J2_9PROT|nr:sel1 repeat family protein [Magnetofaba australis]OSM01472.1 hypothetical protein MAIT1_01441 [Magnetofaba australis IT-1]